MGQGLPVIVAQRMEIKNVFHVMMATIYQTMIVTINTVLAQMDQERLELNVRQMDLIDVPVVIPATTCLLLIIINVE